MNTDDDAFLKQPSVGPRAVLNIPCGYTVSIVSDNTYSAYPLGIAIAPNGKYRLRRAGQQRHADQAST
jgi:hypothetical protein